MSANKWMIMKKLSLLMAIALAAAAGFFVIACIIEEKFSIQALPFVILASVIVFLCIVIIGIKREVDYIHVINEEIQVLEGGDLSREITIRGSDEVTMLAESIDEFRKSMKNQLSMIEQLEESNRLMAAEIAHDLRTPLTALIMYLDFALGEIGDREPQAEEYLVKAREKSVRLKNLLNENFTYNTMPDYSLIEKQQLQAYEVLGGFLGDMMTLLESEGFYVRSDTLYGHSNIIIQRDAAGRVFGNLVSNIMKYAQRDAEVSFYCREKPQYVEVRISNLVRQFEEGKPESTGFGARIVKRLMQEMDGEYQAEEKNGIYTTILRFMKV